MEMNFYLLWEMHESCLCLSKGNTDVAEVTVLKKQNMLKSSQDSTE